jgi:hypothetical protein
MSVALITGLGVVALIGAIAIKQRSAKRTTNTETRREDEDREKDG